MTSGTEKQKLILKRISIDPVGSMIVLLGILRDIMKLIQADSRLSLQMIYLKANQSPTHLYGNEIDSNGEPILVMTGMLVRVPTAS